MNFNHIETKDAFGLSMKHLLRENIITRENIVFNGFTQSPISFNKTISRFEDDKEIMELITKANNEMEFAHKKATNH